MEMPIELKFYEAKREILGLVNKLLGEYGLSCVFVDSIIQDISRQLTTAATNEVQRLATEYNESLKASKNADITECNGDDENSSPKENINE